MFVPIVLVVSAAALTGLALNSFVSIGNFYTGGITGVSLFVKELTGVEFAFNITYYAINFPLIIFGFYKLGRKFTILTLIYIFLTPIFKDIINYTGFFEGDNDRLFIALTGGIVYGFAISLAYRAGGSSGGSDFFATYYSIKKGIAIGKTTTIFNYIVVLVGLTTLSIKNGTGIQGVLSEDLLYTMVFMFVFALTIDKMFPKNRKIAIQVTTFNGKEICKHFKQIEYPRSITVSKTLGAFSNQKNEVLTFIAYYMDMHYILRHVKQIDEKAFINIIPLMAVNGNFGHKEIKKASDKK